jgi:Cft2 family RNA processing exonuclease
LKFTFLGGAESIGASSALVEIDDRRWLVDCGVRMRGTGAERLPDLGLLEAGGAPTAIFATHAHLDHIGALPVLHQRFPLAPVYATAPTIALTRIQLFDSLRIMQEEAIEGELPLYSEETVQSLLEKMIPVTPLRPFRPDPGGPEVTFHPAGHILGASCVAVKGREGSVFASGDVSVDNQRTIPGMKAPRLRASVAIFESTYGKRLHPSRAAEEARLVETVAGTVAGGGKVLIPAFAIGRAQEVILILLKAQLLKHIPQFPIHVDGMVRATCAAYSSFPWYLQSTLRKRVEKHGDPFFGVLETVRPVKGPAARSGIIQGPPCAIVSSSGMLSGGPSQLYAAALLGDPGNLIAITGYQDEESPGRKLLDFAEGRAESLSLGGQELRPAARIATYSLSGHASGAQIVSLIEALGASDVILVHGDSSARRDVADLLVRGRLGRVHLPRQGEPVVPPPSRARRHGPELGGGAEERAGSVRLRVTGIGGKSPGAAMTEDDMGALSRHVRETYREGASFSPDDLHRIWYGAGPATDDDAAGFESALRASAHFSPHPVRLFQFVPREPDVKPAAPFEDVTALMARIDAALPAGAGLLRKSYQSGIPHMTLVFAFPEAAEAKHRDALGIVFSGSGWTYSFHPEPNLTALEREVRAAFPDPDLAARRISTKLHERRVTVYLRRALHDEELPGWDAAAAAIRQRTGFRASFVVEQGTPAAKVARDGEGRLEINLAYAALRKAFEGERHAPHKIGMKPGLGGQASHIELSFISPQVGERYREKLAGIARDIGWRLEVSPTPNQCAILDAARALLASASVRKGPSFVPAERKVRVSLVSPPEPSSWARLAAEFEETTGYSLEEEIFRPRLQS